MDDSIKAAIEKAIEDAPRVPGIDWSMALSVATIRALEKRFPGFRSDVREELEISASKMEASDDADQREDAPSVRELADSWIFTE